MKKIIPLIMAVVFGFMLLGCTQTLSGNDDLVEKAREEISVSDAENIEIEYAGVVTKEGRALIWFITGNEYQEKSYFAMECEVINVNGKQNKYRYIAMHEVIDDRCDDVAVFNWQGGYCFLVNNEDCDKIVIETDKVTEYDIKEKACPYIEYVDPFTSGEYTFYDKEGLELR